MNDLLQTTFDYNYMINSGFEISCHIGGKVHKRVFLSMDAMEYGVNISIEDNELLRLQRFVNRLNCILLFIGESPLSFLSFLSFLLNAITKPPYPMNTFYYSLCVN